MRLIYALSVLGCFMAIIWIDLPLSSATSEITARNNLEKDLMEMESRRFLGLSPFRPFMRVLGMMGIPLLPLLLIRQLVSGGASAANSVGVGGAGAGMGSMGSLSIIGPFGAGAGAGVGGMRPLVGGGLRPFAGLRPLAGLRPIGGQNGLKPGNLFANAAGLGNLIANAAGQGSSKPATGGGTLFMKKRSIKEGNESRSSTFMAALAKLERVVDQYDLSVPDCQRLMVCEVHQRAVNPSLGSFTEKLIQAFGVEARLERTKLTTNTKTVLIDFLKAARNGLQQRDCSAIYYKCPVAVVQMRKKPEAIKSHP